MHTTLLFVALVPTILACGLHPRICNDDIENNIVLGLGGDDDSSGRSSNDIGSNGCPSGWRRFERARGPWCIGTYYNDNRGYTWEEAQMRCQQHRAVLTGIESLDERNYINQTMVAKWKAVYGGVWIGGRRNPACVSPSWSTQVCGNNDTIYQWADGFTSGTSVFKWTPGQPDGNIDPVTNEQQSCIHMYMTNPPQAYKLGQLDDQYCSFRSDDRVGEYGYACGKQAEN